MQVLDTAVWLLHIRGMSSPFGLPPFDPSKMDPKILMKLSQLIAQLPPAQISRLQSLMHNMTAGFDVANDLAQFEKDLPPGFRENLVSILSEQGQLDTVKPVASAPVPAGTSITEEPAEMNIKEARLTILRAVAEGNLSPEQAEALLFK